VRLGQKQELFAVLIAQHIIWLHSKGYRTRIGDVFRDPRAFGKVGEKGPYGSAYSMHKGKCAADLNLFKDGKYLNKTEDHLESGRKWESRHPLCCWGGRFDDGNHYSLTHEGRK
jgi:hypothetical protein